MNDNLTTQQKLRKMKTEDLQKLWYRFVYTSNSIGLDKVTSELRRRGEEV